MLLAFVDQWFSRYSMNPDGVSYLDLGDAFWKGDWKAAFNVCWSPLYGWLAGLALRLTHPSIHWEFPEVHLLNVGILCLALFAFEFFWNEVLTSSGADNWSVGSRRYSWAFGYLLFLRVHVDPDSMGLVTPDQLVAAVSYVIFGLMLRATAARERTPMWLLGCLLGLGYLAKTPMLFFGFVCLAELMVARRSRSISLRSVACAFGLFLAVAGSLIAAISIQHQRFTIGDSGKINIAWHMNKAAPEYEFWEGNHAHDNHAIRKLNSWPAIYEFATPIQGTYPPWYDPSYWYAGADSRFHLKNALSAAVTGTRAISGYGLKLEGALTGVVAIMVLLSDDLRQVWRRWHIFRPIVIPALVYFAMFAVLHWEPRYTFAEAVVLWGTIAVSALMHSEAQRIRVLRAVVWGLAIVICPLALQGTMEAYLNCTQEKVQATVAQNLHDLGIRSGDHIAVIGDGMDAFWARLAQTRIIAEVPSNADVGNPAGDFWNSTPQEKSRILERLKATGAVAVIADNLPAASSPGWLSLGNTGFAVFWLTPKR